MQLFTLDDNFLRTEIIEGYQSAVWVERYSEAGDATITAPPTKAMRDLLKEGTFLQIDNSNEIVLLETVAIEGGVLKAIGPTLEQFLNQRFYKATPGYGDRSNMATGAVGAIMGDAVERTVILDDPPFWVSETAYEYSEFHQKIPNLSLGYLESDVWMDEIVTLNYGQLYDLLTSIAKQYALGFSLYLDSADESGYSLVFTVYNGRDLTRAQEVNEVVKFSPILDNLSNIKELRSIANFKTAAFAYPSDSIPDAFFTVYGRAYAPGWFDAYQPDAPATNGFERRNLIVFADDITEEMAVNDEGLIDLLNEAAANALVNNNYIKVIDGEINPLNQRYIYGEHYKLGDVVELEIPNADYQTARVTEYIRSRDSTGEKAYPTLSLI